MTEFMTSVIGMSISGGAAILLILFIRLLFKPSGRVCCLMWLLVGLRLLLPFSLADMLDINLPEITIPESISAVYTQSMTVPETVAEEIGTVPTDDTSLPEKEAQSVLPTVSAGRIFAFLWQAGAALVAGFAVAGYVKLRLKLRTAVKVREDIYQSEHIPTPFVLGLVRPRIYIPYCVAEADIPFVLEHEKNHIKRNDHISKAAAMAVLALHWFNPLVWAAYILFCRDVETACDEKVISKMDITDRRLYSAALLSCSTGHRIAFCPVAFGEVGVKERIKHIMKYKPAFIKNLLSAVLCISLVICAFIIPVGCTKADATNYDTSLYESLDLNDPYYEGAERIVNKDGTITIPFIPTSNVASDSNQIFCYTGEYEKVAISTNSGVVTSPGEDGRIMYENQSNSHSANAGVPVIWIPNELNASGSDSKINSTVTFTFIGKDGVEDTAVITVISNNKISTPANIHALTVSIDEGHKISLGNGDMPYAITISKAE